MRLQFQARRYRWVRALLVGVLVGVWLLPSTTNTTDLKGFDATGPNKDYPDKMPMGFPFNLPWPQNISDTILEQKNMAARDIVVKWV